MSQGKSDLLSSPMTILSMVNGMIGGFIMILPVLALETGYMSTIIVILVTGVFSYYSCHLCISHVGNQPDLDTAIYKHFGKSAKMKTLYDLCIWSSLLLIDFLYFELITIQWIGLTPPHYFSISNAVLNALALFVITLAMKYFQFGANLMAYGIISIACYLLFLTWVVGSQQTGGSQVEWKSFGSGVVQLAAGMGQAFAIQNFFIPIIKKSEKSKDSNKLVLISYIIGGIAYTYIALMGSYGIIFPKKGILYRDYLGYSEGQKTIEGYFGMGTWEVNFIQLIYLMHLYSVFPEFLLISKKRLFGVLNYPVTPKGQFSAQEVFYIALSVGVCFLITVLKLSIRDIIDLNGAFIGCIIVYILPAIMHIRCLYFAKDKVPITEGHKTSPEQQNKYDVMVEENNLQLEKRQKEQNRDASNEQNVETTKKMPEDNFEIELKPVQHLQGQSKEEKNQKNTYECNCNLKDYSKIGKIINLILVTLMVVLGIFIMVNGLIDLTED